MGVLIRSGIDSTINPFTLQGHLLTQYFAIIQLNNQIKKMFLCSFSQFVVLLYLLTYVGVLTNGLTLVITGEFFFQK